MACVVAVLGGGLVCAGTGSAGESAREYVVLYEEGTSAAAGERAVEAAGGEVVEVNRAIGVATVRSTSGAFAAEATGSSAIEGAALNRVIGRAPADEKAKEDAIEGDATAERTATGSAVGGAGDPLSSQQWDMQAIGATPDGSYAIQRGGRDVRVGIIDTGVDGSHPDIAPNFNGALSRNFTTDDPVIDGACADDPDRSCTDPANVDEDGHGTHVASTVGSPLNGLGMAGVAPEVELVNLRAGQDSGYFFLQPTVDALTYAGDVGVDVVNMSFYVDPWLYNCAANAADSPAEQAQQRTIIAATQRALDYARAKGVTLIAAEGNGHTDLGRPAVDTTSPDYPDADASPHRRTIDNACISMPTEANGVIGVTSVGPTGRKAYYSDYGLEQADVSAPGGDSREYYGTPAYKAPQNTILAAYPESVGRREVDPTTKKVKIDAAGNPTTPSVVKNCANGQCAYYQWIQGTSMASPHAVGVAALIVAAQGVPDPVNGGKTLNPATVERVLTGTATDTPCPEPRRFTYAGEPDDTYTATCEGTAARNGFFGDGLVNALSAASSVGGAGGSSPATSPVATVPIRPGVARPTRTVFAGVPKLTSLFTSRARTRVRRLALVAPVGTVVAVSCRGGGCPRGQAGYRVGATRTRNLAPRFRRTLRPGARITIRAVAPGQKRRTFTLRVRRGLLPKVSRRVG